MSGFLAEAGFSHSLSPARNCGFGCTYCYVPTLGIYGGLKPEDVRRWGRQTTYKSNAAALLRHQIRPAQVIYCSPLVDPYQPAESRQQAMPELWQVVNERPPSVFVLQTRGPLVLRDLDLLRRVAERTRLRISFSLTTDDEQVRRYFEPHCAPIEERLAVMAKLREAGLEVYATLAPLLPCDPERLVQLAVEATGRDLIGDPLHVRSGKPRGATTWSPAWKIAEVRGYDRWLETDFQQEIVSRMQAEAERQGVRFGIGPPAFGWLAKTE